MKKLVTLVVPVAILASAGLGLIGCEEKKAAPKPADKGTTPAPAPTPDPAKK